MLTTNNTGMNKSNSFVLYYNTRGLILYHNSRVSVSIKKKKCRNCGHTNRTVFNSLFCIQPHYHQLYHLKLVHHLD